MTKVTFIKFAMINESRWAIGVRTDGKLSIVTCPSYAEAELQVRGWRETSSGLTEETLPEVIDALRN
jgi:hypothetical protein